MVDLGSRTQGAVTRIAVVMDVRSRAFSTDLRSVIVDLDQRGLRPRVLFLEASDEVLVRRYESVRRAHPLQGEGRLIDGIAAERALLSGCATRPTSSSTPAADRCMSCGERSKRPSRPVHELDGAPVLRATVVDVRIQVRVAAGRRLGRRRAIPAESVLDTRAA